MRARLLTVLVVFAALLGCMLQPSGAAAIAPNPNPTLIARWEPCEPDTGVTVIVDDQHLGEGKIYVGCALGEQANGIDSLEHAGFQLEGVRGEGLFICRIDSEPTFAEQNCYSTPGATAYWSYWHGEPGGSWGYSGCGAGSCKPRLGEVQGWSFSGDGGGAPRIEPMDGAGPHVFTLPAEQESSVVPAVLARVWLTTATAANISAIEDHPSTISGEILERLLAQVEALTQAGVSAGAFQQLTALLAASCEIHNVETQGCILHSLYNPQEHKFSERGVATAVLGLQALGQDTESFAGDDPRGALEGMIEPNGEVQQSAGGEPTEEVDALAQTVLAIARSGTLPANALASVELLLAQQQPDGQFGDAGIQTATATQVQAIQALSAAAKQGDVVLGTSRLGAVETALRKAGEYLESIEEQRGGVRSRENSTAEYAPSVLSTAQGALGLALAGRHSAAERAAKWVSSYQVTAEYAGHGNTEAGEHTPAEQLIGAFMPDEGALKEVLRYGEKTSTEGSAVRAQEATWPALLALETAGPYGPYYATFDQESLFFEMRPLGSPSMPLTATLTNRDVRSVTIATVSVSGSEPADFSVTGGNCAGRTLAPGETCEAQVAFDPATLGLHEAHLHATLTGTSQTIQIPLDGTGTPAPEPQPQPKIEPKTEPGAGPLVSPPSPTPIPGHSVSGPAPGLGVQSISPAWLLLKFTAPGVATVKIAQLRGKGHHRRWQAIKTIIVKARKAGALDVKLPRLSAGSYRVSISLAGAKTVVKTLTVPSRRR
jgi:hypothetical protein